MKPVATHSSPSLFASLGSGSQGNAFYVGTNRQGVLIDCGLPLRTLDERLKAVRLSFDAVRAILLTHEHGDHIRGLERLLKKRPRPVLGSPGTLRQLRNLVGDNACPLRFEDRVDVAGLEVEVHAIPHDALQPRAFKLRGERFDLGFVTDMGYACPRVIAAMQGVDFLYIEANHDPDLLAAGPYPAWLQARVAGKRGHLSNQETAEFLSGMGLLLPQFVVLGHLSQQNNRPDLARAAVEAVVGGRGIRVELATQNGAQVFEIPLREGAAARSLLF